MRTCKECTWYQSAFITFSFHLILFWLPWQSSLTNRKIRYRSIICSKSAFIWWKDCENRSSTSRDIRLNTLVFWPCHTRHSQMSSVSYGVTWPNFDKIFTGYRGIIYAVNAHIEVAISHFITKYQNDERGEFAFFSQNWLSWQGLTRLSKKRSRSIICTQNAFIW